MKFLLFAVYVLLCVHNGQSSLVATANLHIDSSELGIGTVLFYQLDADSPVRVAGIIDSLKSNTVHGFHVHRDPLRNGEFNCTAAGPHFNPYNTSHGSNTDGIKNRHVGDLGNLTTDENGIIIVEITDSIIDLYNATRSIANRTVVLHAMRDDGGKGGFPDSATTGNAGARIACGVISISTGESYTKAHPSKAPTMISDFFRKLFP